jgi:hypothetical protein
MPFTGLSFGSPVFLFLEMIWHAGHNHVGLEEQGAFHRSQNALGAAAGRTARKLAGGRHTTERAPFGALPIWLIARANSGIRLLSQCSEYGYPTKPDQTEVNS